MKITGPTVAPYLDDHFLDRVHRAYQAESMDEREEKFFTSFAADVRALIDQLAEQDMPYPAPSSQIARTAVPLSPNSFTGAARGHAGNDC